MHLVCIHNPSVAASRQRKGYGCKPGAWHLACPQPRVAAARLPWAVEYNPLGVNGLQVFALVVGFHLSCVSPPGEKGQGVKGEGAMTKTACADPCRLAGQRRSSVSRSPCRRRRLIDPCRFASRRMVSDSQKNLAYLPLVRCGEGNNARFSLPKGD